MDTSVDRASGGPAGAKARQGLTGYPGRWFMYSCEDRLRAVRLYTKLGERVGLTIRQLGYPTKNALESWRRECERRH